MRKILFTAFAATLFFSCSPTDVELSNPEKTNLESKNSFDEPPSEINNFHNNKYWLLYKDRRFELYNRESKTHGQFEVNYAEKLLRMPGTVWEIPIGAPYEFSITSGLVFNKNHLKWK